MEKKTRAEEILSVLMLCLVLAAAAQFFLRGPVRTIRLGGGDFAAPYVASLRFCRGLNPYTHADFIPFWRAAGAPSTAEMDPSGQRPVYPPPTLLAVAPFAAISWRHALVCYVMCSTVLYVGLLFLLSAMIGERWNSWPRLGFLAFGFALAPVQTGITVSNLSVLSFVLSMYALLLGNKHKDAPAGLLLGSAICLKPTVGLLMLTYFLFCRRWKLFGVAASSAALVAGAALLRMAQLPHAWISDYRDKIAFLVGPDGVANFASTGDQRFDLLNLQVPFFALTHSAAFANLLTWLLVGLAGLLWATLLLRNRYLQGRWETAGSILLLGLLPVYQRNYNAGFVLLGLLWALRNYRSAAGKWILALGTLFLLPGEALLRVEHERIPQMLTRSMAWNTLIMPQASWGVLLMALILLGVMSRFPPQDAPVSRLDRAI